MRRVSALAVATWALASLLATAGAGAQTRVAALGASTTRGTGSSPGQSYPDQLRRLLGSGFEVRNFGRGGATVVRQSASNYWGSPELAAALAFQPDVAILWIGGADSAAAVWDRGRGEFLADFRALIDRLRALPGGPRVMVMLSSARADQGSVRARVVNEEIRPLQALAAMQAGVPVIDAPAALMGRPEYYADGIHLSNMGYAVIARLVQEAITSAPPPDAGPVADARLPPTEGDAGPESPAAVDAAAAHGDVPAVDPSAPADAAALDAGPAAPPAGRDAAAPPRGADKAPASPGKSGGCSVLPPGGGRRSPAAGAVVLGLLLARRLARRRSPLPPRRRGLVAPD